MTMFKWSTIAATNGTADPTAAFPEGMGAPALNDGARGMMAAIAKYRDDTAGSLVLVGTSTAYTVASNEGFGSTTDLDKQMITFVAAFTNGANPTLNVDGLGAFPLVMANAVPVPAGSMVATAIYSATFYKSFNEFRLHAIYANAFNVPLGGLMDYICPVVPNSNFVFPIGQAISRTAFATLFAAIGTTYGAGDGTTTFNVPDLTGRTTAMKEAAGTRLTTAGSGVDGGTLGAVGGGQNSTLVTGNLPPYTPAGTNGAITVAPPASTPFYPASNGSIGNQPPAGGGGQNAPTTNTSWSTASNMTGPAPTFTGSPQGGTSTPFRTVQPTIIVNKILRII